MSPKRKVLLISVGFIALVVILYVFVFDSTVHVYPLVKDISVPTEEPIKSGYVTFWFDDGLRSTYETAFPELDKLGWDAVIAVVASKEAALIKFEPYGDTILTTDQLKTLVANGWEISSHSLTHAKLNSLTEPLDLNVEIAGSKEALISKGFEPFSFTAPYGELGGEAGQIMIKRNYFYWRSMSPGLNETPPDRHLKSYFINANITLDEVRGWIQEAETKDQWLIIGFHAILDPDKITSKWQHTPEQFINVLSLVEDSSLEVVLPVEMFDRFGYKGLEKGELPELSWFGALPAPPAEPIFGKDNFEAGEEIFLSIPSISVSSKIGIANCLNNVAASNNDMIPLDYTQLESLPVLICEDANPIVHEIGAKGLSLVIGHRQYGLIPKVFARLNEIKIGDEIQVVNNTSGFVLTYKVTESPREFYPNKLWDELGPIKDQSLKNGDSTLVLLTCSPYGTSLRRLIVVANLEEVSKNETTSKNQSGSDNPGS